MKNFKGNIHGDIFPKILYEKSETQDYTPDVFPRIFQIYQERLIWAILAIIDRCSHQRCSVKKVFLKVSQNLQESFCARVSFLRPATLLKKRPWYRCFPVNFEKFKNIYFEEHLRTALSELILNYLQIFELHTFPPIVFMRCFLRNDKLSDV